MLTIGYLYHKACNEGYWTDRKERPAQFHLPLELDLGGISYCKYLQRHSKVDGLEMEIKRQLLSGEGFGIMIRNTIDIQRNNVPVLNVCMSNNNNNDNIEHFIRPWSNARTNLNIPDSSNHHTDHTEQRKLFHVAYDIIKRYVPETLLVSFPCPSQFYDSNSIPEMNFLNNLTYYKEPLLNNHPLCCRSDWDRQ